MHTDSPFQTATEVYPKHTTLIAPGEGDKFAWSIIEGIVRQYDILPSGDEVTLNIYKQGSVLSLTWLLGGNQNKYFYECETEVRIKKIPAQRYIEFLKNNPEHTYALLCNVARGLDGVFSRISTFSSNSARRRILHALHIEASRFGAQVGNGIELSIQTQVLAKRAGLTRETTSRQLRLLHDEGVIARNGKRITINQQ